MTDPEVSLLLNCAAWRGLVEAQVHVELSDSFNRRTDPTLERHIEEVWAERLNKEPWLFNGSKFRLHSFSLASLSSSPPEHPAYARPPHILASIRAPEEEELRNSRQQRAEEGLSTDDSFFNATLSSLDQRKEVLQAAESRPLLTLRLGLTCYRDYLGTNWSCRQADLCQRGEAEFSDPLALLAQPLGVGAVLCTCDEQVVLIRRSQRVAEAGGLLDIPGGHPEPKLVCECLGQAVQEEHISVGMMQPRAVVSELFLSVRAEIRDEVNIPLSVLREPVLLGVALNHINAGRPSAEFFVSCSLSSVEVRDLYLKGGAEAHESTEILFLSRKDLLQLDRSSPLWSELCPSAKGAILLYQAVRPDHD